MKVTYKPLEEVVIHHLFKHSLESFIQRYVNPKTSTIAWAHGYLLWFSHYRDSDLIIEESIKGIDHIASIDYCAYEKYTERILNKKLNCEVLVINQEADLVVKEIIKVIEQEEKK